MFSGLFANKKVQGFSIDRKMLMSLLSVLFRLQNHVSVFFEIFNQDIWGNVHYVPEINLTSQGIEAATRGVLYKKVFLEIWQNSQGNTCARASFLIKLQTTPATLIKKESLAHVLSYEFCEISKNTFFTEDRRATASVKERIHY